MDEVRNLIFYANAVATYLAGGMLLTRWGLPFFIAWPLAWFGGAVWGVGQMGIALQIPGMDPDRKASGSVPLIELIITYTITCVVGSILIASFQRTRAKVIGAPVPLPEWLLWVPVGLFALTVTAHLVSWSGGKLRNWRGRG